MTFNILTKIGVGLSGIALAGILYASFLTLRDQVYLMLPTSQVFSVQQTIVPDFPFGTDPVIQYDRKISQSFVGDFSVELKSATTGDTECFGSGRGINYSIGELHSENITLAWYLNIKPGQLYVACPTISTGQHFLETNYTIHMEGLPTKYLTTHSNVFEIQPKGSSQLG